MILSLNVMALSMLCANRTVSQVSDVPHGPLVYSNYWVVFICLCDLFSWSRQFEYLVMIRKKCKSLISSSIVTKRRKEKGGGAGFNQTELAAVSGC